MKRKAEPNGAGGRMKRPKTELSTEEAHSRFREGLFDEAVHKRYRDEYASSAPYKHAVIESLVDDALLRSVRDEIRTNVVFTPKETDIYKIHQSGDLANLDGLDDESLAKLPSLLRLRDAVYSASFREYVSGVTGCGPLSGRKTDMAINVYTPGCFLLCHDDVIGSRRVSYILYLTDPDTPWQPEWGGALRLFPVQEIEGAADGKVARTPLPDPCKVIPPAWNQLSFFAVQPGESFHDVEEVYHARTEEELGKQGGRIRMAISGWFHIPQEGEEGYIPGEEEANLRNSSLMQLQGNPAQYDAPQPLVVPVVDGAKADDEVEFDEADIEFLLKYMAPTFLTPDTLEQVNALFEEDSSITLPDLLSESFSQRLRDYVTAAEDDARRGPDLETPAIEAGSPWRVAKPPHKHRYLYQRPGGPDGLRTSRDENPLTDLLDNLLPSRQFRTWLQMATGCKVEGHDVMARRFRPGKDYTLATGHEGKPRLELNLCITPTDGWTIDELEEEEGGQKQRRAEERQRRKEEEDVGGHEVYMAAADDEDEDAAVYNAGADDDDNILFFQSPAWNTMSIVLRDSGALRFVKYVSKRAKGDRWDISGAFEVEQAADDGDQNGGPSGAVTGDSDDVGDEELFSDESESD
ncbi:Oxoglutarate and iron-dependent oxygenase degradation C-term [Geosmithia morbida]|uniref:uS12 prolyl 3,4-dihydroxylase n=1 Tax=Geosmithia morbida TaxID=1094350 RepID=A0A9P5D4U9_9HYPO|nr:Oxoglutarate and iron-dependent oxygenase degradation C-term [Geosmithia morbida]KAF4123916.1 Oxoglutarate and iron-dependent oxygenase degradation C-term [Geosmithia morbida]